MEAPTPDELGPLLGETAALDEPAPLDDETGGEFEAAAMRAVGTRQKATALRDAIMSVLREQALLSEPDAEAEPIELEDGDLEEDDLPF